MPNNEVAKQVFGTMGTICWSGQLVPQIWKSWREKSTEGLSHWLMFSWGIGAAFLGVYVIIQNFAVALVVQPQLFGLLGLVSWGQCLFYGFKFSAFHSTLILLAVIVLLGGFEVGMVYAVRPSVEHGNEAGVYVFGIGTSVLLILGLLPQYVEIFKLGEVKGISLVFMTIDTLGGVFSILSLVFSGKVDILAAIAYALVVVFDSVILILSAILNPRAERRRQRAAQELEHGEVSPATTHARFIERQSGETTSIQSPIEQVGNAHEKSGEKFVDEANEKKY